MPKILIHDGNHATVDPENFHYLAQFAWNLHPRGYAHRKDQATGVSILMHREVVRAAPGERVHHLNGDKLDNRKENLSVSTSEPGSYAGDLHSRGGSSPFKGVTWHKPTGKWRSVIRHRGGLIQIGHYRDEISAARAYDREAKRLRGERANTNEDLFGTYW